MSVEKVLHVTEESFEQDVMDSKIPVVVDFWAPWCGPCRLVGPIMEQLAQDYDGVVKICKVNVDDQKQLAMRYRVMSIPTVIFFRNGEVVKKSIGAKPKEDFAALIDEMLSSN